MSPLPSPRSPDGEPRSLDELARRLGAVVERSPADETEVVWLETLDGAAASPAAPGAVDGEAPPRRRRTVQVRVRERGRGGFHRTGLASSAAPRELDAAVRLALGQARLAVVGPPLPLAGPGGSRDGGAELHDPAVAGLDAATARDLLEAGRRDGERLRLDWHEVRLVVANSRGLAHGVEATAVTLAVRCGDGPGAGRAAGSARTLAALAAPEVVERARARHAGEGAATAEAPAAPLPVLLAPEAAAALVQALSDATLSSRAVLDGLSCFAGRLGEAVVDPAFSLTDDGTDAAGLPFPMDCDGWPKRPVPLIEAGVLASPAIDAELSRLLGRTPTPHAISFDESRPSHLFVAAGGADDEALLRAAEAGLWIAALDELRVTDPAAGAFRARAAGVRRIEGGSLAAPVPDLDWRGDLPAALGRLAAVGARAVTRAAHGAWGACRAPALLLPAADGLRPLA